MSSLDGRRLPAEDDGVSTLAMGKVRWVPRATRDPPARHTPAQAGVERTWRALGPRRTLEADVPVVSVHLFSGVVRVGHDAYRTRHRRLFAKGVLVILVDIAHFFSPLAETVVAALGDDHLDAGGVLVGDYSAHRRTVLPDVHQRRVGHLVAR